MSWTEDLLITLAKPYAAFELQAGGRTYTFDDLTALCAWVLERKGAFRLSLANGRLIWGDQPGEERSTVLLELRGNIGAGQEQVVETWRIVTECEDAAALLAAVKAVRASRKAAA